MRRTSIRRQVYDLTQRSPLANALLQAPIQIYKNVNNRLNREKNLILFNLQNNILNDIDLRVDEFDGNFLINSKSDLFKRLITSGKYEPEWSSEFLSYVNEGSHVVDVGANIGFYTVAAAKRGARVLSIEPTEGAFRRLRENVERNGVADRVILFQGLLADADGVKNLHVIEGMEEYSSINPIHPSYKRENSSKTVETPTRSLDSLTREYNFHPNLMKVDTEGAELLVFSGASNVLQVDRPIVMSELSNMLLGRFGTNCDEVVNLLQRNNYSVLLPGEEPLIKGNDGYGEILCIPNK